MIIIFAVRNLICLKTPFLRFSRDDLLPEKVVNHQSGQAKIINTILKNFVVRGCLSGGSVGGDHLPVIVIKSEW